MLRQLGCDVVGPAPNVQRALEVIDGSSPDAALLDIDLDGESVAPVAARLRERSIPFAFTTGYQDPDLPPEFHSAPQLRKPFRSQQLAEVIATLLKDRTAPA